jgi:CheY-specific phosphatase CheX
MEQAAKHYKEKACESDAEIKKAWEEDIHTLRTVGLNEIPIFEKVLLAHIIEKIITHLMEKTGLVIPVEKEHSGNDISGVIELDIKGRDNFKGFIIISFTSDFILKMATTMFGESMQKINGEVEDMVTEFAGLVSHRIKSEMNEDPFNPYISAMPLTTVVGKTHKMIYHKGKTFLHTNYDGFSINITLEE